MQDLVVRGGTVVDGTGADARTADVAISDSVVTAVGRVDGTATRTIDADGLLVTPGFVDIHAHYDGQASWDERMIPSSWHGVTTIVAGNCGVGFAPVRPTDHGRLIELMEGVEDIPGAALHEGLKWNWNSFGEFLDAVDERPHDIDVAAQVPRRRLEAVVPGGLPVVVGVDVDDAGDHERTVGVDLAGSRTIDPSHLDDQTVAHRHVGRAGFGPVAVVE